MFSEIFVKTPLKIPLMMLCNWSMRAIYQNNLLIQLCEATSSFPCINATVDSIENHLIITVTTHLIDTIHSSPDTKY